jgi:hypothetical protein
MKKGFFYQVANLTVGQAPIMHYNYDPMMAILWGRVPNLGEAV